MYIEKKLELFVLNIIENLIIKFFVLFGIGNLLSLNIFILLMWKYLDLINYLF